MKTYRQTWFSVLVLLVAIATGAIGLATVLNLSERASHVQHLRPWYDYTQFHHISALSERPLTVLDYKDLKSNIEHPLIAIAEETFTLEDDSQLRLVGVDSLSAISAIAFFETNQQTEIQSLSSSRLFGSSIFMNEATLALLESTLHPDLTVLMNEHNVSIQPELTDGLVITDIGSLVKNDLKNSSIATVIIPGNVSPELSASIRSALPDHLIISFPDNRFAATQMSESFQLNLLALGLLMFAVCMFIVLNAGNLLLHKRMPMLMVLRQLGFSRNRIIFVQFIELCSITLLVTVGATIISYNLDSHLAKQLTPIIGQNELTTPMQVRFVQLAAVCTAGALLAFIPPLKNLKRNLIASQNTGQPLKQKALFIGSLLVCVLSLVMLFSSTWLSVLLTATAAFILSICGLLLILLPLTIASIKNALRTSGVTIALSSSAADALTTRTSLAFCAFFIAVTCNIGMNLMVDSFEQATQRWLDQRLIADAYIYSDLPIDDTAFSTLDGHTVEIIPRFEDKQSYNGKPIDVYSYPSSQDYRNALSFQEVSAQAWQQYQDSSAVFVNQQFANIHNKSVGDRVSLITPAMKRLSDFEIAGIYYDYGNPYGQVIMPLTAFDASSDKQVFALHADPMLSESQLAELRDATRVQVFSAQALVALSMQAFNDTFLITNVLNLVTLLVAAIALACTILVLMEDTRRHQFLLKSLGFSSAQVIKMSLIQYVLLIVSGLLLATPFGICVSWILINVINLNAFQWQYPLVVEPAVLVKIYLVSLGIVLMAIALPVLTTSKRPISEELACID